MLWSYQYKFHQQNTLVKEKKYLQLFTSEIIYGLNFAIVILKYVYSLFTLPNGMKKDKIEENKVKTL